MEKFLYVALFCGILSGGGMFMGMPPFPSVALPIIISLIGIICSLITIKDKDVNGFLKLGGVLINIMPLFGAFTLMR